jgi:hypothetical protein
MDFNDRETVALVGGGHTFGKCHGSCKVSPGDPPSLNPSNSWSNRCPVSGDVITSGFEGPWTVTPFHWNNDYFANLMDTEWERWTGPGGKSQWRDKNNPNGPFMMLTSDVALKVDPKYGPWSLFYYNDSNIMKFTEDFKVPFCNCADILPVYILFFIFKFNSQTFRFESTGSLVQADYSRYGPHHSVLASARSAISRASSISVSAPDAAS